MSLVTCNDIVSVFANGVTAFIEAYHLIIPLSAFAKILIVLVPQIESSLADVFTNIGATLTLASIGTLRPTQLPDTGST